MTRFRTPGEVAGELRGDEFALYELIWKRTVASQMTDARGTTATRPPRRDPPPTARRPPSSPSRGTVITFRGFLAAYEEGRDDEAAARDDGADEERRLPKLSVGDPLAVVRAEADGHETQPPARYTEASLVKALEERGIGRPSTYASIIGTILDRGYVFKKGQALVPTWLAFAVTHLLEEHFGDLVDYEFTASMEEDLDGIAGGDEGRVAWLTRFYFGDEADRVRRAAQPRRGPRRHRRPGDHVDPASVTASSCASGATARTSSGRPAGVEPATGEAAEGVEGATPRRARSPRTSRPTS